MPKDLSNLIEGGSTYGVLEYVSYLNTLFIDLWLALSDTWGMGMGLGLIGLSLFAKALFTPTAIYSVSNTIFLDSKCFMSLINNYTL